MSLDDYTDSELRGELVRREQKRLVEWQEVNRCRECDALLTERSTEREHAKHAPKWRGWPIPPPEHLTEYVPVVDHITDTCANGHVVKYDQAIPGVIA